MAALNRVTLPPMWSRFERIAPDTRPRWGTLSPAKLFAHLRFTTQLSLNETRQESVGNFITRSAPFRFVILAVPFPKGIKAPDYMTPEPQEEFLAERAALHAAMQRFVEALVADPNRLGNSPLMGDVTLEFWSQLHAKHFEHHLRQFGV